MRRRCGRGGFNATTTSARSLAMLAFVVVLSTIIAPDGSSKTAGRLPSVVVVEAFRAGTASTSSAAATTTTRTAAAKANGKKNTTTTTTARKSTLATIVGTGDPAPPLKKLTKRARLWEDRFALLARYKLREGDCDVPFRYKEDEQPLGAWLYTQRVYKKKDMLSPSREERLETLGVVWNNVHAHHWEEWFELLRRYKEQRGHCAVPQHYVTEEGDGKPLGEWLKTQRRMKKTGVLDPAREDRLERLGVAWDASVQKWEDMYGLLRTCMERDVAVAGVPTYSCQEEKHVVGPWLSRQRFAYKNGTLDPLKSKLLEDIGVDWDPQSRQWEYSFARLERYKRRVGDCNAPHSHKEGDGLALGAWLNTQRVAKKRGKLAPERARRLDDLGIVWNFK